MLGTDPINFDYTDSDLLVKLEEFSRPHEKTRFGLMVISEFWPSQYLEGFHQAGVPVIPSYFVEAVRARRPNYVFFGLAPNAYPGVTQLIMRPEMAFHSVLTWHLDFSMTWRQ